ncbi:RNA polymerase sigma factor SigJ [Roseibium suaedae]|uniref:RNA polymerase sigma-70 factor, ECF subfamily n=1 Tax=Roseibium suaedae TaxID=735517 RepID=A0A1M7M949_9HYPH|nr:RNA polymerase sigma factor SigJ [Roseibium suaedae]SHM87311.1 RNA polymerase sigma-70 factor, ECF subfamily [Roseibium suaedae]
MSEPDAKTALFEKVRPQLMGLAYRMLGVVADAEDAVQDTFLKWQAVDPSQLLNGEAWLVRVCTNRCLDLLKAASRTRVDYIGSWIPEPLQTETCNSQEEDLDRAQSLTTAFLLLLERLTPRERAAFLLREVFGKSYAEVAETLGMSEAACRQLVSRSTKSVRQEKARFRPSADQQSAFLEAFQAALVTGAPDQLSMLLAETVNLSSDGGGKATALRRVLSGQDEVSRYIARIFGRLWLGTRIERREMNGIEGLVVWEGQQVVAAMTLGFTEEGQVANIYIMRNPDKLRHLGQRFRHDLQSGSLKQH